MKSGLRDDCTDYVQMDKFFKKYEGIDAIIHFAALKAVGESVEKPLPYYRNNPSCLISSMLQTELICYSVSLAS